MFYNEVLTIYCLLQPLSGYKHKQLNPLLVKYAWLDCDNLEDL